MEQTQPTRSSSPPAESEYTSFFGHYISLVPEGDVVRLLDEQLDPTLELIRSCPKERHGWRYAPGKWTTEDVIGHIVDTERLFSYRAMCFAHGLTGVGLAGIDQDVMVAAAGASSRSFESFAVEFEHLRRANLALYASLGDADLGQVGNASGAPISVRALIYITYGHVKHHSDVLRERYLE